MKSERIVLFSHNKKKQEMNRKCKIMLLAMAIVTFNSACKRETIDEKIKRDCVEFTAKNCPKNVDPCTLLDSMCFDLKTRVLSYNYTVSETLDDESLYTDLLRSTFRENVLKEIKNNIQMKGYKKAEITFEYVYTSKKTGKKLMKLKFTPEEYK